MGARAGRIEMIRARFGIYTCQNDGRFAAALLRNVISVCTGNDRRSLAHLKIGRIFVF